MTYCGGEDKNQGKTTRCCGFWLENEQKTGLKNAIFGPVFCCFHG